MTTRFVRVGDQPSIVHYWGRMRFLGRMDSETTMYAVDFEDEAPHLWHYHEQDELIVVAKGSIRQMTGTKDGKVTNDQVLAAGDAVLLAKGEYHAASPLEPGTQVVFTIKGGDGIYRAFERNGEVLVGPGT